MLKNTPPLPVDLTYCETEPIHIPNRIQPHGVLILVSEPSRTVIQVSANLEAALGIAPEKALGIPLTDLLGEDANKLMSDFLVDHAVSQLPLTGPRLVISRTGRNFETMIHHNTAGLILELVDCEPTPEIPLTMLHEAINQIDQTSTITDFCQRAVEQVRRFTGFDRVMVYRFLEDDSGVVIAESTREGLGAYLGLHYPASDIPLKARELYLRNWVRIIADVNSAPVSLVPTLNPQTNKPLDMTHCLLRYVSSVHIEYLRNMRVGASSSLSIVSGNRLWGLIACHHRSPKNLSSNTREACELIAHIVSIQMNFKERQETLHQRAQLRQIQQGLSEGLNPDLLPLMESCGFALHLEGEWTSIGQIPERSALEALLVWLNEKNEDVVAFDRWPLECPLSPQQVEAFAGALVVRLSKQENGYALWFRAEWVHTIPWAGDPAKPAEPGSDGLRLNPRKSFDLWTEKVRGHSRPWRYFEKVWAQEIRRSFIEIILRREERRMAQLNSGLEKEITQRTEELRRKDQILLQANKLEAIGRFSGGIAHDFNNLLLGTVGMIEELRDSLPAGDDRLKGIQDVLHAMDRAFALTKQLLGFARRQPSNPTPLVLKDSIENLSNLLRKLAGSTIRIIFDLEQTACVSLDQTHLEQILLNLVANASDAMPRGGTLTLRTRTANEPTTGITSVILEVQDTGAGMPPDVQAHIFEPFYSTKSSDTRTGLGLATVYGIIKQAQGEIEVQSEVGKGTLFRLSFAATPPGR